MRVTNSKGEELYTVVVSNSNESMPMVSLMTYKGAMDYFNSFIKEANNDTWMIKLVEKKEVDDRHWATLVKNHKGWGGNFLSCIWVDPAYYFG